MTAAVLYGREDMKIERVDIPSLAEDDVLVRVEVALTCGTDLKVWKQGFHARMIQPPALFGHELAGVVEEKGSAVNGGVRKGMRVVPSNSAPCNVCMYCRKGQPNLCEDLLFNNGAYAEYIRIPGRIVRQNMLEIPDQVPFVDAAMVEPLACVLRGIHETNVQRGRDGRSRRMRADRTEIYSDTFRPRRPRHRDRKTAKPDARGGTPRRDGCDRCFGSRKSHSAGKAALRRGTRRGRGD